MQVTEIPYGHSDKKKKVHSWMFHILKRFQNQLNGVTLYCMLLFVFFFPQKFCVYGYLKMQRTYLER